MYLQLLLFMMLVLATINLLNYHDPREVNTIGIVLSGKLAAYQ